MYNRRNARRSRWTSATVCAFASITIAGCGGQTHRATDTAPVRTETAPPTTAGSGIETYGHPATPPQHTAIVSALHSYDLAIANDDGQRACSYLSTAIRAQVLDLLARRAQRGRADCATAVTQIFARNTRHTLASLIHTQITAIRVSAGQAFAILHQPNMPPAFLPLHLENNQWRVAALESTTIPPNAAG